MAMEHIGKVLLLALNYGGFAYCDFALLVWIAAAPRLIRKIGAMKYMLISICWNGALFAAWEWSGWIAKITFPQTLPDLLDKIGHIFSYLFILLMLYGLPIYTGIIILYVMICFLWKLIKKHRAASAK